MREFSSKSLFRTLILKWKTLCSWWIFSSVPVKGAYIEKRLCFVAGKMEEPSILQRAFQLIGKIKHLTATVSVGFREVSCFTGSLVPKSQVPEEECCCRDDTALSLLPQGAVAVWLWSWPWFPCVFGDSVFFPYSGEKSMLLKKK